MSGAEIDFAPPRLYVRDGLSQVIARRVVDQELTNPERVKHSDNAKFE